MTTPYAMVRGSAFRVSELGPCGYAFGGSWVVSRGAASIALTAKTYRHAGGATATEATDELRLVETEWDEVIGYDADITLTHVDPDILEIVSGNSAFRYSLGGPAYGFDVRANGRPPTFALEIWSKLAGPGCSNLYGYTLVPRLSGGYLTGLTAANGLSTLELKGATTQRGNQWTVDCDGIGFDATPFDTTPFDDPGLLCNEDAPAYDRFWVNARVGALPALGRYKHTLG